MMLGEVIGGSAALVSAVSSKWPPSKWQLSDSAGFQLL